MPLGMGMAERDRFDACLQAGELDAALALAWQQAVALEVATCMDAEAEGGERTVRTHIDTVGGRIDNELSLELAERGVPPALQQYHLEQIRNSQAMLPAHLEVLQQRFPKLAALMSQLPEAGEPNASDGASSP
jgi:hypothetical protein